MRMSQFISLKKTINSVVGAMGKGRDKRKKKEQQLAPNRIAQEAKAKRLAELKAKKAGKAAPSAAAAAAAAAATSGSGGSSSSNKKNKKKKKKKGNAAAADDDDDEEEEDIETILANLKREQEEKFKVTEELNADPPSPRSNASLTANPLNAAELILFGGEHFNGQKCMFYNDLFRFNLDKKEWRRITSPNTPGPRSSHQAVATPTGLMFLFGGEFASASESQFFHYRDFWVLDVKTSSWEKLEPKEKPSPRSGHRMVLWKTYLLLFGGFYDTVKETKYHDDLWSFDVNNRVWTKLSVMENTPKPSPRSGFAMFVHNDQLFVYGGYCKTFNKGEKAKGIVHTDLWSLKLTPDLKGLRWDKRKRTGFAPTPRSGLSVAMHKNRAVFFGGVFDTDVSDEQMQSTFYNEMFLFQADSMRWFPLTLRAAKKPKQRVKRPPKSQQANASGGKSKGKSPAVDNDDDDAQSSDSDGEEDALKRIEDDGNEGYDDNADVDDPTHVRGKPTPAPTAPAAVAAPVAIAPAPVPEVPGVETTLPEAPIYPAPRANAMMAVQRNTLYIYGGWYEQEDHEITLGDFYALNLEKLDRFETILEQPKVEYIASSSSDDDSDEDDDDDDDDEDGDDDDDGSESDNEAPTTVITDAPETAAAAAASNTAVAVATSDTAGARPPAESAEPVPVATAVVPTPAAAPVVGESWEDLDEGAENSDDEDGDGRSRGSSAFQSSNIKSKTAGREQRQKLLEQLQIENELAVPKFGESLADFYARTTKYWTNEAFERTANRGKELRRSGFDLAKEKYEQMQPILQQMHELDLLETEQAEKAAAKKGGPGGKAAPAARMRR